MPRIPRERSSAGLILAAREMRGELTQAEAALWQALRQKHLDFVKFRRQVIVGPYILDFYCIELKLAIEVDGKGHEDPGQKQYDQERTDFLNEKGITVLRFTNEQVMFSLEIVIGDIHAWIEKHKHD